MTESLAQELDDFRMRVSTQAIAAKDSQAAVFRLRDRFAQLNEEEWEEAKQVVLRWIASSDESERFDGLYLVDEFAIADALPALRQLADVCERSNEPAAPYDWAKVNRIIGRLVETTR